MNWPGPFDSPHARLAFWAVLVVTGLRSGELAYAARTARGLRARGALFVADDGYGAIVAVQAAWLVGCALEPLLHRVSGFGGVLSWVGGGLFVAGLGLRYWSMVCLGARWSTRVFVLRGLPLVRTGPYRFLRHPIYVGVTLELLGLPLVCGAPWTLVAIAPLHALATMRRILREERALAVASGSTDVVFAKP